MSIDQAPQTLFDEILALLPSQNSLSKEASALTEKLGDLRQLVEKRTQLNQENFLRTVLSSLPCLVSYMDRKLNYLYVNEAYERWFGVTREHCLKSNMIDIVGQSGVNLVKPYLNAAYRGEPQNFESVVPYRFGGNRTIRVQYIPDQTQSPEVCGITVIVNDITALKDAESRLIQASKLACLGHMSAGIAHEINNPLTIIATSVFLLEKSINDPEKFKSKIKFINNGIERIVKIIAGLKKFSTSDNYPVHSKQPLSAIVGDALKFIELKAKRHLTPIEIELKTESQIMGNHLEIAQVIINLLGNGIDAVKNSANKWVKLRTFDENSQVVLQVLDSGTELTPEIEKQMFDPFFTTKPVGQGIGLGLSISKGILDQHGATIALNRTETTTCFEVRFKKIT